MTEGNSRSNGIEGSSKMGTRRGFEVGILRMEASAALRGETFLMRTLFHLDFISLDWHPT